MNWLDATLCNPSALQAVVIICLISAIGLSLGKLRILGISQLMFFLKKGCPHIIRCGNTV